jgi:hypothetical protein
MYIYRLRMAEIKYEVNYHFCKTPIGKKVYNKYYVFNLNFKIIL